MKAFTLALALAIACALSLPAQGAPMANEGTLLRAETLRKAPRTDAAAGALLPAGAKVGVLDSRPGWLHVGSAAGTGWVRMFSVARASSTPPATPPATTTVVDTDPAAPAPMAPTRSLARTSSHALLLGIGEFSAARVPPLPGVAHDLRSAREMALSMGVPPAQIVVARNDSLSLDGMVRTVQQLVERVQPGARVFLYYSGHGTRYRDSGRPGSPCVTSLLTHEGAPFTDSMMAEALNMLADKTDKLFVFVDACFSGGAVAPARGSGWTPKFFARSGADAQCGTPSNIVTRGLESTGAQRWKGRDNFIYLTAARDTEIAFEDSAAGGFATRAVHDCALREARDLDASGNLSIDEISQCAQQRIDTWLAGSRDYTPHHLTVFGNRGFIPALAPGAGPTVASLPVMAPPPAPTPPPVTAMPTAPRPPVAPAPVQTPAVSPPAAALPTTPRPPVVAAPAPTPTASSPVAARPPALPPTSAAPQAAPPLTAVTIHPERTLRDIYAQRDARREVNVTVSRDVVQIGQGRLDLRISSTQAGYLYLLYAGSDGKTFDMLFPNQLDRDNFILARRPVPLPRAGWMIQTRGPAGINHLLAIVSDAPRDFSQLGLRPAGAFSTLAATPQAARELVFASTVSTAAGSSDCASRAGTSDAGKPCSNAFGAALVEIREVP